MYLKMSKRRIAFKNEENSEEEFCLDFCNKLFDEDELIRFVIVLIMPNLCSDIISKKSHVQRLNILSDTDNKSIGYTFLSAFRPQRLTLCFFEYTFTLDKC